MEHNLLMSSWSWLHDLPMEREASLTKLPIATWCTLARDEERERERERGRERERERERETERGTGIVGTQQSEVVCLESRHAILHTTRNDWYRFGQP